MSRTLRLIMGDHLSRDISSLRDVDPVSDMVLMVEIVSEIVNVPHHKQKIVLVLSAMRHFAEDLAAEGVAVDYVTLDDPENSGTFSGEIARAIARHGADRLVLTEPSEWRVIEEIRALGERADVAVDIRPDDRFFATPERFARWAEGKKALRMEFFYREMRRESGILMEGGEPVGGQWNFDPENRRSLPKGHVAPAVPQFPPDATTRAVMALVAERFAHHFGEMEAFNWPVTRADALRALKGFVERRLDRFGDYQDAMQRGEPFLYHSLIAPALNLGLLTAREVCEAAEASYRAGLAPLNAVEGFIRQILGWREYVRGLYRLLMPDYLETNALEATRPLPDFYWTGETDMACIRDVVSQTRKYAYAHHIQRLMVTGNFALLAGISPSEVEEWYLAVYADAFDWVEAPNTHGMALFADGGRLASKPYAASGAYINRMSDYCGGCAYDHKARIGEKACPFNALYWRFLMEHEERFRANPRMAMPYRNLAAMKAEDRSALFESAEAFLATLKPWRPA